MKVQDVKAGYSTPWYTVSNDAIVLPDKSTVQLTVRYPDGGESVRVFDYDHDLPQKGD